LTVDQGDEVVARRRQRDPGVRVVPFGHVHQLAVAQPAAEGDPEIGHPAHHRPVHPRLAAYLLGVVPERGRLPAPRRAALHGARHVGRPAPVPASRTVLYESSPASPPGAAPAVSPAGLRARPVRRPVAWDRQIGPDRGGRMYDAWRAYLEVAMGLTQASRRKAEQIARDLVGRGGATASQLQNMAEELLAAGRANREALAKLVRYELERALGAVGLASADEVRALEERVRRL